MTSRKFLRLIPVVIFLTVPGASSAAQIAIDDFGPRVQVEDFESLADVGGTLFEPLHVNGNSFTTSSGTIRMFPRTSIPVSTVCLGGPSEGHAINPGTCIGTGSEDLETMEIELGSPSVRAGLWVGLTERISEPLAWSRALVSFFDEENTLLGTVEIYGHTFGFAGWEVEPFAQDIRIARILVEDIAENNRVVVVDDLMWETSLIPEPGTVVLLLIGVSGFGFGLRERQRNGLLARG